MPKNSRALQAPLAITLALALVGIASCASNQAPLADRVPPSLVAPSSEHVVAKVHAKGTQAYECLAGVAGTQWKFLGPKAVLTDDRGEQVGTHYAGPTWEAADGSKVVGRAVANAPADDGVSIPQLLLKATGTTGTGRFSKVTSIQRLGTHDGQAP